MVRNGYDARWKTYIVLQNAVPSSNVTLRPAGQRRGPHIRIAASPRPDCRSIICFEEKVVADSLVNIYWP